MDVNYLYVNQYDGELNAVTPITFREGVVQMIVDMTLVAEKELLSRDELDTLADMSGDVTFEKTFDTGQLSVYKLSNREEANAFYRKGKNIYSGKVTKL